MLEPLSTGTPFLFLLVGAIAASISITAATMGLGRWLRTKHDETIGRRRVQSKKLRRLACGVRAAYLEEVIGTPAFLNKQKSEGGEPASEERIYVLPDAFVQVYCTADSVIEAFAITTRSRRFAPKLEIPWGGSRKDKLIVRLGRTLYSELGSDKPLAASGWAGARHWGYHEVHFFGNPGFYQTYILASNDVSDVGWPSERSDWSAILVISGEDRINVLAPPAAWDSFRTAAAPNTFCVVGPHVDEQRFTGSVGVEMDVLRVLPDE
ncbi:MAG: hypothetical protein M3313_16480 [Actinomycetota bacterium]|nr:hypothetical protein [Actinomycetota bacterium]